MNKLLVGGAIVAASAVVAAPKIISLNIAETITGLVQNVTEMPIYNAEIKSMDSGWFSTSGVILVTLELDKVMPPSSPDKAPMDDIEIELDFNIDHAPVLTSGSKLANIEVNYRAENLKSSVTWDHAKPLYQIHAQIDLSGDLSYQDKSEKFQFTSDDNIKFDVKSYAGNAHTLDGHLIYTGELPAIDVTSPEVNMTLQQLVFDSVIKGDLASMFNYDQIPQYEMTVSVNQIEVKNETSPDVLTLDHMSILVNSELDDATNLVRSDQIYKLGRFSFGEYFGEEFEIALEVNKLDKNMYMELAKIFSEPAPVEHPEQQVEKMVTFLESNLLTILGPEPEFNITRFKGKLPEGHFNAVLNAKIENVETAPATIKDPNFWLSHVNASSQVQISRPLFTVAVAKFIRGQLVNNPQLADATPEEIDQITVQQTPQYIAMLESQGMIVPNEATDEYTVDFSIAERAAKLNGNDIPLPL
ncbi:YdgA family protein [Psychrosphaera sp. B3R10]|uniref:DUF945 family protein n=1 Tax=unclassified Psychrosphaera TaxID=2641570 RepID=UPI001C08AEC0|nr:MULTISPECIES: DUF945 family protein [unclassified Psychrosphaera]MBU2883750.1 YdgA family protein [Psychrosphaera sp. I2R16]MBU2987948.1 YdgA family protein [Psychrosphaera sp. B3R10]